MSPQAHSGNLEYLHADSMRTQHLTNWQMLGRVSTLHPSKQVSWGLAGNSHNHVYDV